MKMNNKGQGAMEYLMTYGWAILVVIIVGIVLWQSGVFGTGSGGVSGFSKVRVEDYAWSVSQGWHVSFENAAGRTMKKINITYSNDFENVTETGVNWAPGREYAYTVEDNCSALDAGYVVDISINYLSEAGLNHTETGSIRGKCEA